MGLETAVDPALIRGLATALPYFVLGYPCLGLSLSRAGRWADACHIVDHGSSPPWPHPVSAPPLHGPGKRFAAPDGRISEPPASAQARRSNCCGPTLAASEYPPVTKQEGRSLPTLLAEVFSRRLPGAHQVTDGFAHRIRNLRSPSVRRRATAGPRRLRRAGLSRRALRAVWEATRARRHRKWPKPRFDGEGHSRSVQPRSKNAVAALCAPFS